MSAKTKIALILGIGIGVPLIIALATAWRQETADLEVIWLEYGPRQASGSVRTRTIIYGCEMWVWASHRKDRRLQCYAEDDTVAMPMRPPIPGRTPGGAKTFQPGSRIYVTKGSSFEFTVETNGATLPFPVPMKLVGMDGKEYRFIQTDGRKVGPHY